MKIYFFKTECQLNLKVPFDFFYKKVIFHKMKKFKKFIISQKIFFITIFTVLIFDKITKSIVKNTFYLGESRKVIGNFFRLTYIENTGIAFGILSDWSHPIKSILLFVLSIFALIFLISIYIKSEKKFLTQLTFGLIFGGAIGNIFDRVFYGKVVDFFDFGVKNYRWPFFNIADASITIGLIIILLFANFLEKKKSKKLKRKK